MIIKAEDTELESFIKTGCSKKYRRFKDKRFLSELSHTYTAMDSVESIEELRQFRAIGLHEHSCPEYSILFNHKRGRLSLNLEVRQGAIVLKDITEI